MDARQERRQEHRAGWYNIHIYNQAKIIYPDWNKLDNTERQVVMAFIYSGKMARRKMILYGRQATPADEVGMHFERLRKQAARPKGEKNFYLDNVGRMILYYVNELKAQRKRIDDILNEGNFIVFERDHEIYRKGTPEKYRYDKDIISHLALLDGRHTQDGKNHDADVYFFKTKKKMEEFWRYINTMETDFI